MMSRRAFTLLEFMIVAAILAFTVGAALVLVRNQALGSLTGDAQIISDRLEEAQSRAIAGIAGTSWGIHFDNTGATPFYALFAGSVYASASTTYYLSGVVKFTVPASGTSTDVVFTKLTGLAATTTAITLSLRNNASTTATVTVTSQGQISVN